MHKVTHKSIKEDLEHGEGMVGYYLSPELTKTNITNVIKLNVVLCRYLGEEIGDSLLFGEMCVWCYENCRDKWYLDWNRDEARFAEETDMIAFKLRWS